MFWPLSRYTLSFWDPAPALNRVNLPTTRLVRANPSPNTHPLALSQPPKMSRPGSAAPRNLTLTEELEKLEQSITLTLQGPLVLLIWSLTRLSV